MDRDPAGIRTTSVPRVDLTERNHGVTTRDDGEPKMSP
jgi:hypothetical protein